MSGHILELSSNVERKRVVYCNRYGLEITGELYYSKGANLNQKHPTLIVGAPYGGVKEKDLVYMEMNWHRKDLLY